MRETTLGMMLLASVACSPGGDGQGTGVEIPEGARAACGDTEPQLEDVWVELPEPQSEPPAILLAAEVLDLDSDLHWYAMQVWWDDTPDGVVAAEGSYLEVYGRLDETPCTVASTTLRMRITVTGGLPRGDEIDLGVRIEDDAGNYSNGGALEVVTTALPE
jgi:hypothetical protein